MKRAVFFVLGLILLLAVSAAWPRPVAADTSPESSGIPKDAVRAVSLGECVRLALEYNQDILVTSHDAPIAEAAVREAWGIFDPSLRVEISRLRDDRGSVAQTLLPSESYTFVSDDESFHEREQRVALTGRLPLGLEYSFGASRHETAAAGLDADDWGHEITLRLPLLRGAGTRTFTGIRLARNQRTITEADVKLQTIRAVSSVIHAYWNCVAANENLKVSESALANSQQLLSDNKARHRIGSVAWTDVEKSQAAVSQRESAVIAARARVLQAQDRLKQAIGYRPGDERAAPAIVPCDAPSLDEPVPDVYESINLAHAHRVELTRHDLLISAAEIVCNRAANDALPSLDLIARTGDSDGHYRSYSVEQMYSRRDREESHSFGVELSMPLGNIAARNARHRSRIELKKTEQIRQRALQDIEWEVTQAIRDLETSRDRAFKLMETAELRQKSLRSEEKLLAADMSSSYQVIQMQDDLVNAELQAVQARIDFENALVDLHVAQGTLLDWLGIRMESEGAK